MLDLIMILNGLFYFIILFTYELTRSNTASFQFSLFFFLLHYIRYLHFVFRCYSVVFDYPISCHSSFVFFLTLPILSIVLSHSILKNVDRTHFLFNKGVLQCDVASDQSYYIYTQSLFLSHFVFIYCSLFLCCSSIYICTRFHSFSSE